MSDDNKNLADAKKNDNDTTNDGKAPIEDAKPETNSPAARTVDTGNNGVLDLKALILLAILLAAGFVLDFVLGKAISTTTGGLIAPEFIISAFCLEILIVRPKLPQALVIGLISAAVIQLTTTSPFLDFPAEGVAAILMALIVNAADKGKKTELLIPALGTFVTTVVSGLIFMLIKIAMIGIASGIVGAMLPVILLTGVFNGMLVTALYDPVKKAIDAKK